MSKTLEDRIRRPGPKRILSCDGGGILGLISVEILAKLETDLRTALGKGDEFVLADYFDFVCGTSTGAIISTCIATGMSMTAIREFYVGSGKQMFDPAWLIRRLNFSYNAEPLAEKLQSELDRALDYQGVDGKPHATLGNDKLRTLLMMVMRNHNTDSPWPVWNNPFAKYNLRTKPDGTPRFNCNLDLPLWQLVRASTAAPTFFPPEVVTFAEKTKDETSFIFVDGGVTTYNNPAFLAFQMATASPYKVNWKTGTDQLLIVSVGTGSAPKARPNIRPGEMNLLHYATSIPSALMNAAQAGWDMSCRTIGECRFGPEIDREFGAMVVDAGAGGSANWTGNKAFAYVRYDPDVTQAGLRDLGLDRIDADNVQKMDSVEHIDHMQTVGAAYAGKYVSTKDHLRGFV